MFDCTDYHVRNLSNIKTCACVSKHFITSIAPIKSQPKIATHNVCKLPLTIICVRSQLCVFQNKDFTTQVVVHSMIQVYYFLSALNIKSWWVFQKKCSTYKCFGLLKYFLMDECLQIFGNQGWEQCSQSRANKHLTKILGCVMGTIPLSERINMLASISASSSRNENSLYEGLVSTSHLSISRLS